MPKRGVWVACTTLTLLNTGCVLIRRNPSGPSLAQLALAQSDTIRVSTVVPGVRHLYAWQGAGPWAIHVLEVRRPCTPVWQARKSGPPLTGRATTSEFGFGALAAVNADFFALPQGTPVGAHVRASEVLVGPAERNVSVGFSRNRHWIDSVSLAASVRGRQFNAPIVQVNRARPGAAPVAVRLFTHWFGAGAPRDSMIMSARLRQLGAGRGVVELIDSTGNSIWLDSSHVVLHVPKSTSLNLRDTLRWSVQLRTAGVAPPAREVLGGFPWLLRAGQDVLSQQSGVRPDFGERRHPRTVIGFARDGTTLLVVVDGRQPSYSDGMTLSELTALMQKLGAVDALNFDGGGSSAMVVHSRILNRPSDAAGERPVGNALALVRCE